jgi:hypothetical protein
MPSAIGKWSANTSLHSGLEGKNGIPPTRQGFVWSKGIMGLDWEIEKLEDWKIGRI